MSRFKIKLRLPEQDSSSSIASSSPSTQAHTMNTAAASPSQEKAASTPVAATASTPTPLTSQNMRENDASMAGESSRAEGTQEGDASMAAASSMADESEDELASGDDDDVSRGGTPSSSTAAGLAAGDDRNSPAMKLIARQKRSARLAELEKMTAEEIDALPPAKRRVGAKARGASGPGRGWRKGLKMGDKPRYTLPDTTPVAEGTPNSFDDSRRGSPFSAMSGSPEPSMLGRPSSVQGPSRPPATTVLSGSSSGAPLAFAAPGQRAKKGELSHTAQAALAGKSILPSGRAPVAVAAMMAFGPPVKPPVKIVNVFPPAYPASSRDVSKKCRNWVRGERQFVNLAGRVVKVGTWWGGEDEGYDPEEQAVASAAAAAAAAAPAATATTTTASSSTLGVAAGSAMSPTASRQATPSVGPPIEPIPRKDAASSTATATAPTSSKSKSSGASRSGKSKGKGAAATPFIRASSPNAAGAAAGAAGGTKGSSPSSHLPKPKFQPGGGGADWKSGGGLGSPTPAASSPAGRK